MFGHVLAIEGGSEFISTPNKVIELWSFVVIEVSGHGFDLRTAAEAYGDMACKACSVAIGAR